MKKGAERHSNHRWVQLEISQALQGFADASFNQPGQEIRIRLRVAFRGKNELVGSPAFSPLHGAAFGVEEAGAN
jgi:hypothetical protein